MCCFKSNNYGENMLLISNCFTNCSEKSKRSASLLCRRGGSCVLFHRANAETFQQTGFIDRVTPPPFELDENPATASLPRMYGSSVCLLLPSAYPYLPMYLVFVPRARTYIQEASHHLSASTINDTRPARRAPYRDRGKRVRPTRLPSHLGRRGWRRGAE